MKKEIIFLIFLAHTVLTGCAGGKPDNGAPTTAPPIVKELLFFEDGGTTGIVLEQDGNEVSLCFDGRLLTETPGRIYAGAAHPEADNAELLPRGSDREKELVALLQKYLDSQCSSQKQAELLAKGNPDLPEPERDAWRILRAIRYWKSTAELKR